MPNIDVSVIIPAKDIDQYISAIIENILGKLCGIQVELIVVDMHSSDKTMLSALKTIKESGQSGFVIQNGMDGVPAALNAGIYKASGKYITFLFPRKIYKSLISQYFETAQACNADFVFGSVPGSHEKLSAALQSNAIKGADLITGVIKGLVNIDLGAVLINREFLQKRKIFFNDRSRYGFAEEFIYKLLLKTDKNYQSSAILYRDKKQEPPFVKPEPAGINCFDRIDGLLRILDIVEYDHSENHRLYALFTYTVLPGAVFDCIDLLLKEGMGYSAIKNAIRLRGYDELLVSGKNTDARIKRNLITWKLMPWMYRPGK